MILLYHTGKPIGDGSLANTRLPDMERIIFLLAAQNLHRALKLLLPSNQRIDIVQRIIQANRKLLPYFFRQIVRRGFILLYGAAFLLLTRRTCMSGSSHLLI